VCPPAVATVLVAVALPIADMLRRQPG
jgi:hypothetical protein